VIHSSLKPGTTAPITSKVIASEAKSSGAQTLAWLSPMIKILFLCGFEIHLILPFTAAVFPTKPVK
jgi:hypothetical protein